MQDWKTIRAWRHDVRKTLRHKRLEQSASDRRAADAAIRRTLSDLHELHAAGAIGFYWPFEGEVDLRPLVSDLIQGGTAAALPVIVEKNQPLEFWQWTPGMVLEPGVWDTRVPSDGQPLAVDVLLVPLLGFDPTGYRLGNGGGYFDRTLAIMAPRPLAISVGYETCALETIFPQPHDIPMDVVVTEERTMRRLEDLPETPRKNSDSVRSYASSPCFMAEFE